MDRVVFNNKISELKSNSNNSWWTREREGKIINDLLSLEENENSGAKKKLLIIRSKTMIC